MGKKVAIIGAGAAGCFCAIELSRRLPDAEITVYEAGRAPLAKVAITGGGRCNLTNTFASIRNLKDAYPRGHRLISRCFYSFDHRSTVSWFEKEGVKLVVQDDQCIFPQSQDAMQIVRTLTALMRRLGVEVRTGTRVERIADLFEGPAKADAVVLTAGGCSKATLTRMLEGTGVQVTETVPSLFTFKIDTPLRELMGTVVDDVCLTLDGKFESRGTLLLTDWGMSGPAVLKLSSYGARHLHENGYRGSLRVNFLGCKAGGKPHTADDARELLTRLGRCYPARQLSSQHPEALTFRLWNALLQQAGLDPAARWSETSSKSLNRLAETLTCSIYPINGRARFKEEFVTCGGVDLASVNLNTLEAKNFPGLYFAGEVLDIDAITGGFNLQAAWSTGYVVAHSI